MATTRPRIPALLFFETAVLISTLLAAVWVYSPRELSRLSPRFSAPPQALPEDRSNVPAASRLVPGGAPGSAGVPPTPLSPDVLAPLKEAPSPTASTELEIEGHYAPHRNSRRARGSPPWVLFETCQGSPRRCSSLRRIFLCRLSGAAYPRHRRLRLRPHRRIRPMIRPFQRLIQLPHRRQPLSRSSSR